MDLKQYTLHIISIIIGSVGFGSMITHLLNKSKIRAEISKTNAEANNTIGKTYDDLLENLRVQIHFLGEQIASQNNHINALQARELELMKIINGQQETERELRRQIRALETKLSKRIGNLENN